MAENTLAQNIAEAVELINNYRGIVEGTATEIIIPAGTTNIRNDAFSYYENLTSVTIPNSVTSIGYDAFYTCESLTSITIPNSVTSIAGLAFSNCTSLTSVTIPDSVTSIYNEAFSGCTSLTDVTIPSSITRIKESAFYDCSALTNVTIGNGFNCNNLDLSASTLYSTETIVGWLNALADRTGQPAYTLTIGSTNLAKLSAEQIAIATNKNWNLA